MFRICAALLLKGVAIEIYGYRSTQNLQTKKTIDFKLTETFIITDSYFYRLTDTSLGPDNAFVLL